MKQFVRYYLAVYNLSAFIFWSLFLLQFLFSSFELTDIGIVLLNIAQGMALLEVVHTILKWVKSPIISTAAQVFSRIFVLVLINLFRHHEPLLALTHIGFIIVAIAWSITEIVRYSYYFLLLFNREPRWLLWMRYSFFIILYPLGVTGEWLILGTPIFEQGITLNLYTLVIGITLIAYIYYFPVLYGYMWRQRKAKV